MSRLLDHLRYHVANYRTKHFRRREKYREDYRRVAGALLEMLEFSTTYDVGCANGFLLEALADAGKKVAGIERSPAVLPVLRPDLREHVVIGDFSAAAGRWELVCCTEVAEHVPPHRSQELVDALTSLAIRWIYFTAAPPGQGGRGHINCRPHQEWLDWFAARGWTLDTASTARLRGELADLHQAVWLAPNSLLLAPQATSADPV